MALAAVTVGASAQAAVFNVANEADLITAINDANASTDPTSTINYTAVIPITTVLPQLKANVSVVVGNRVTTIGSASGASLEVQAGASFQSTNSIRVGVVANTSGSLVAQGSGATVSGTVLQTGPGQATIRVLDGATVTVSGNAELGGNNAASNKGVTTVVVSGQGSALTSTAAGYYQHDGTLEVSGGGVVRANVIQLGLSPGDVFSGVVTGGGSTLATNSGVLNIGSNGTATVTVGGGATISSANFMSIGGQAAGVGTLNIGAAVGSAPIAPGIVIAPSINGGTGTSTVNFNHNATDYQFSVPITGTKMVVNQIGSGTTILTGANTYTGGTSITAGTLQLGNGGTTGSIAGNVTNNATLAIKRSNAYGFSGAISGSGAFQQLGVGTTTLSGTNTYTGGTTVQAGRLLAGSAGAFVQNTAYTVNGGTLDLGSWDLTASNFSGSGGTVALNARTLTVDQAIDSAYAGAITGTGSVIKAGGGSLTISGTSTYSGTTTVTAGTLRTGADHAFSANSATTVASAATLDLAGFDQTLSSLSNAGTVSLVGGTPGTTLTITDAYVGSGGTLRLGTSLGDSSSASDRLVLSGASASATGTTRVQVTNLGGLGALTTGNGIELITATGGATTTAQSTKDAFSLAGGHVDAGAYEYRLYAADASGAGENWYLRSTAMPTGPAVEPGTAPGPVVLYRTEVPLYAVQPEQFREMDFAMLGNLHQRVGDERSAAATGDWGGRQGWGRIISIDRDIAQQGTVSPSSSGRLNGFQAGTDLWANSSWRAGLYAGQLEGDMDVNGFARGMVNYASGRNDLRSQYLGAYATWSQPGGLYVDSVLQAGRHRYTAYPSSGQASTGKGDSVVASIEAGQGFPIAPRWVVEPQLQLAWQHLSLDDTAISGASIQQDTDGGWIVRAGVRVKGFFDAGPGTLQPYARLNLYKRSSGTDITHFIGPAASTDITSRTGGTSSELALGTTWQLSTTTSLYGEVGKLWDLGGDARTSSGINGSVGVKVLW